MNAQATAHALETIKISHVFTRHAMQAAEHMRNYREIMARLDTEVEYSPADVCNMLHETALNERDTAYAIMFPYRQEFKFRAWCRDEEVAETKIELIYGEC